jgi:hypothetical protein
MGFFSEKLAENSVSKSHIPKYSVHKCRNAVREKGEYKRREEDPPKGTSPPWPKDVEEAFVLVASSFNTPSRKDWMYFLYFRNEQPTSLIPHSLQQIRRANLIWDWDGIERKRRKEKEPRGRGNVCCGGQDILTVPVKKSHYFAKFFILLQ